MSSGSGYLFLFKVEVVDHFESMFVKSFDLNLGLLSVFLGEKWPVDIDRGKYFASFSGISNVLRTSLPILRETDTFHMKQLYIIQTER